MKLFQQMLVAGASASLLAPMAVQASDVMKLNPSTLDSNSFTNKVLAQIELFNKSEIYAKEVYVLPKHLDEMVARLHLDKIGAKLTKLTKEQADYINVSVEGPYKPELYRY